MLTSILLIFFIVGSHTYLIDRRRIIYVKHFATIFIHQVTSLKSESTKQLKITLKTIFFNKSARIFCDLTALFEKVYRTKFQSKRRWLVFKTGVIMYIQNNNFNNTYKIFLSIYLHIFISLKKLKHKINICCEFDI